MHAEQREELFVSMVYMQKGVNELHQVPFQIFTLSKFFFSNSQLCYFDLNCLP